MIADIFQMIPDTVDAFQQLITDDLAVPDDVVILSAQLDPPVTGVHVGEMRQSAAALLELRQLSALHMGADAVAVLSVFQVFLGILICPVGTDELHRLTAIHSGEHQRIAHRIIVRLLGCIRLVELVASLAAHPSGGAAHGRQCAVTGGIDEDIAVDRKFRLRGVLVSDDGSNFFTVHDDIVHISVQISVQILLKMYLFPDHGIEYRERCVGIAPLIFQ